MRRPFVVAGLLSAAILSAQLIFPVAALTDPTGIPLPDGIHLAFPALNIVLAPLFDAWDGVTLLAMERLHAFLLGAAVLGVAWSVLSANRDGRPRWGLAAVRAVLFVVGLGLFVLGGIAWRRPMAHIAGVPRGFEVVDLHSHTTVSHDVKGRLQDDFDLEASRRWHERGGFNTFFVTDHNRIDGWAGKDLQAMSPLACPGEELSLWGAHIVTLGNTDSIPQAMYADSAAGILRLLAESETRWHALTLASIPEYDANHFDALPIWVLAGLDGFEVSNAAPKANRQSLAHVDSVVTLARNAGRWVAGVTDQHGMGATVQAWTLIEPGIARDSIGAGAPLRCREIVAALATGGATATKVIERHRLRIDSQWPFWSTTVAVFWEGWRAAGWAQLASWLLWIWGVALLVARRPRQVEV